MRLGLILMMLVGTMAGGASGQFVPIYGGPTFDSSTGTGLVFPDLQYRPGSSAGSGFAVGSASKYVVNTMTGSRAVRWDKSGSVIELEGLGTDPNGYPTSQAYAVNDNGIAVGFAQKNAGGYYMDRAVRWDASGVATELENLGGYSSAFAINTQGTSVGYAVKSDSTGYGGVRAVRWSASGTAATELDGLGGDGSANSFSQASAINDAGTAAGHSAKFASNDFKGSRAVRWDASGTAATELGDLGTDDDGISNNYVYAINEGGTVVGYSSKYDEGVYMGYRAVRWDASGTAATELGDLGSDNGVTYSEAYSINKVGTAVGYATKYQGNTNLDIRAVRWDASGTAATELPNVGNYDLVSGLSIATAINDSGIAVGLVLDYDNHEHYAVIWGPDGAATKLSDLIDPNTGWGSLIAAYDINNDNWITGIGIFYPDGPGSLSAYERLFLMQVPEPVPMSLATIALLQILTRQRIKTQVI